MGKPSEAEKKEKKRIAEKRRREKIKNDPILYERQKQKDRERYAKNKAEGKVKKMSERSRREQKALRKYYREHSKKSYDKKKRNLLSVLDEKLISIPSGSKVLNDHDPLSASRTLGANSPINIICTTEPQSPISNIGITELQSPLSSFADSSVPVSPNIPNNFSASRTIGSKSTRNVGIEPQSPINTFTDSSVPVSPTIFDFENITPASPLSPGCSSSITVTSPNSSISRRLRSKVHNDLLAAVHSSITETPKKRPCARSSFKKYKYRVTKELKLLHHRITELQKKNQTCQKKIIRLRSQKNKALTTLKKKTSGSSSQQESSESIKRMSSVNIKEIVVNFYEDDENSRMCPGKKDYKVQNKVRKQKRFVTGSLLELHKKFQAQHPELNISYSLFCRLRPFWVIIPNVQARETCSCQTHENFNFVVSALHKHKIISEGSANHIVEIMCCDPRNVSCLTRECLECRNKKLTYLKFDSNAEVVYSVWEKQKKAYNKNGDEKITLQTVKVKKHISPKDLLEHFETMLYPYMSHIANIISQFRYTKKIKAELCYDQCIIHCDFSQNYCTKYANEIQSFHFGSSRQQISLHTSVIYYMKHGKLVTQSFCTISECLRHDAVAIWEHLMPVLRFIEDEIPEIQSLIFISDSPSAQYRNRKMFFIMSSLHWNLPSLGCIEWNYTEHGHGKGAPDGVGGCLKSTADKIVARGHDIPDLTTFVNLLKRHVDNIKIEVVDESGFFEKEMLIPDDLSEFRGTLSIHQVIWNANNKKKLAMRKLSCCHEDCLHKSVACHHGLHTGFYELKSADYTKNRQLSKKDKLNVTKYPLKKIDLNNKPQILSCKIIKPAAASSSLDKPTPALVPVKTENIQMKMVSMKVSDFGANLSDIELSGNDSFWGAKINIENLMTPTLGDTKFTDIKIDSDSEDDYKIF